MTITMGIEYVISLILGLIAVFATFGQILVMRLDKRIEEQNQRIEKLLEELTQIKTRLPVEYHRREDAQRFETQILAKLDVIYGRIAFIWKETPRKDTHD